jgi:bifunctional enzyme CysN/CysC
VHPSATPAAAARRTAARPEPQLLRFATAGSVDDGKSTLIGRLLYDAKALMADQVADAEVDLARLTDGLRAEREQGITIDVAYRHFQTPRRRFIIADTPGHAQYTRNMVTGASTADLAVVLVDAREGLLTQSRRHAAIAGLLRIPRIVLAVNKMDLVDFDQDVFRRICADFRSWAARTPYPPTPEIACIPVSALEGDNVVERSPRMDWYGGPSLLEYLEGAPVAAGVADGPLRLPVQYVIRQGETRRYAGQLAGGTLRAGQEVVVLPSGVRTRIAAVETPEGQVEAAAAPLSVSVALEDEVDVGRGALIVAVDAPPAAARDVRATLCWMGENPARVGGRYLLKHTTRSERARLEAIHSTLQVETLEPRPGADTLGLNEIGRVSVRTSADLHFDPYASNRATGAFILIDDASNETVGAGMIEDPLDG